MIFPDRHYLFELYPYCKPPFFACGLSYHTLITFHPSAYSIKLLTLLSSFVVICDSHKLLSTTAQNLPNIFS
jgi:hypothetical protein